MQQPTSKAESDRSGPDRPGSHSTSRSERRIVTALFCDVVGSTAIAERLDPEEWVEILDEAFALIAAPVARYEGTLVRLLGDALLAYFGAPVTHEDDPERAILAGLDIVEALEPFRERISNEFSTEFDVRIGISTGEAIVGAMAVAPGETTALGDAVNVAARLQQGAQPGSIMISSDTLRQVTGLFEVQDVGPVEIKGKRESVQAYRVLRYCPPVRLLRGRRYPDGPLVGRDREMDQLILALESMRSGRGHLVLLTGEAGIGKTRLIDEAYRAWGAANEPGGWVEARAISYDALRPYGVFHQLLRQLEFEPATGSAGSPSSALQVATNGNESSEEILATSVILGTAPVSNFELGGEEFRRRLYDEVSGFVSNRVASRPLVLAMDDLHWADAASVDLLLHVCGLVEDSSLLVLLSMRPERASPAWRIKEVLERTLPHRLTTLEIGPLSEDSSNELLKALAGERGIETGLAGIVLDRGSGNPLFLEELTLELREQQQGTEGETPRELPVPDSLKALMAARIDHLDQESRATLQRAAIIGRSFPVDILELIDPAGTDVSRYLNVLERSGLLQETQRVPERQYTFRHDLMRETAIRSVLRRQRRAIHRQVAVALENTRSDRIGDVAHQIARHYSEAGDIERAVHFSMLAGERARNLYALDEAVIDFTTALELLARHDAQSPLQQRLLYERGSLRVIVGDFENAQRDLEDSRSLARVSGDRQAEWQALIRLGDLWTGRDYNKAGEYFGLALQLAESISDQHILARSKVQIANWQLNNALADEAIEHLGTALEIFEAVNDRRSIAETVDLLGMAADVSGDLDSWMHHLRRSAELYRELDDRKGLASVLTTLSALPAFSAFEVFAIQVEHTSLDYDAEIKEALEITREIGWRSGEAYALMTQGLRSFAAGRLGDAFRWARDAERAASEITHHEWLAGAYASQATFYQAILDSEESIRNAERAALEADQSGSVHWHTLTSGLLAEILVEAGYLVRARDVLINFPEDMPTAVMGQRMIAISRIDYYLAAGRHPEALELADQMIDSARSLTSIQDAPDLIRRRGLALIGMGHPDQGIEALELALEAAIERRLVDRVWRFRNDLACALTANAQLLEAEQQLNAAWQDVRRLARTLDQEDLRDMFLQRAHQKLFSDADSTGNL